MLNRASASILLLLLSTTLAAAPVSVRQSGFQAAEDGLPAGWTVWSPRPEIAPRAFVDAIHFRHRPGSLALSGNSNPAVFGGWTYTAKGVEPGKWYRFTGFYRAEGAMDERLQVVARLDWRRADGNRAGQPEYAYRISHEGEWRRVTMEAPAPERAAAVTLQLILQNAPQATVWWDDIALEEIQPPAPRQVTVASVNLRPRDSKSPAESVSRFVETVERAVPKDADLILLPEGITVVGTRGTYAQVSETIPGPTTDTLGELARRRKAWIVAGIYEREGTTLYNTAVVINREGKVAGSYRKVYLPREELEGGLTPGSGYPVFQTDFGKIGVMICWDVQYADPARALALRGAEIVLLPIWGGNETLGKARAIENHIFLVSSGYDYPTSIVAPDGEILSITRENGAVAVAKVDLNRRYVEPWLGYMRARFFKELRLDVPVRPADSLP